jgi:hypothetical protein
LKQEKQMTQPNSTLSSFFSGGGKAAKFPSIGDTVSGTITAVHPPEPQRDFESGQDIPGKSQVRIELSTELRDPAIEFDDGSRTLYVRGWMQGSIGEALRKAGVNEPKVGGQLSVTYTEDGAPSRPGLRGPKKYTATYTPPQSSTGQFFGQNGTVTAAAQNAPIPDQPPAGIDPAAWASMPADAKQAITNTIAAKPPF